MPILHSIFFKNIRNIKNKNAILSYQWRWGGDGGTNTKPNGGNVPNLTAAMYQTIRRQCTKLYGGNLPNCTAAMYQTVRRQLALS